MVPGTMDKKAETGTDETGTELPWFRGTITTRCADHTAPKGAGAFRATRGLTLQAPVFTFAHFIGTNSALQRPVVGAGSNGGEAVVSRRYLTRQTSALIKFAQTTINPKLAAVSVHRAADLKAQLDETMPPVDLSPQALDVEPAGTIQRLASANEKFTSPQVSIRRHIASQTCDVVVSVRGREIILRCPDYSQALKWARLECKSYKISEPEIEPLISESEIEPRIPEPEIEPVSGLDHDEELPSFLRSPRNN